MLISYKWLESLVGTQIEPYELSKRLTLAGLEIDGTHEKDGDVIYDIEVTSNRGDCLSHLGVAREVAAFTGKQLVLPGISESNPTETDRVEIRDTDLCFRFTSRIIKGIKVGPSPKWLVERLEAVGERSINNIADITNYVMHELGQPMHAFDLDKLNEQRIVVRRARKGEKLVTLDDVERDLDESMLAICDAESPVAIAGIMGGLDSGITEESTNVLLEVAWFEPQSIRDTSRNLGLSTEASYRFERGVDPENIIRASNRACDLICELGGGTADEFTDIYPVKPGKVSIQIPNVSAEVTRLTGLEIDEETTDEYLSRLGITKSDPETYEIPVWRHDLSIPEDLVEEVTRIIGYDKIGESVPASGSSGEYHKNESRKRRMRVALADAGFSEAMSYSFIGSAAAAGIQSISDSGTDVRINDPIIEGSDLMRPTLIPGMLDAVRTNFNHKINNLRLFELGRVFVGGREGELPVENEHIAFAMTGRESFSETAAAGRDLDFLDLKGAIELAVEALGLPRLEFRPTDSVPHLQPGQSAEIFCDGAKIGNAGKVSNDTSAGYKFKQSVFVAELSLERLLETSEIAATYTPLPVFPSVTRDITMLVPNAVGFGQILTLLDGGDFDYFEKAVYVGTYTGSGVQAGERSLTIRLEYRSLDRTLTDEDVDRVHETVLKTLEKGLDVRFR